MSVLSVLVILKQKCACVVQFQANQSICWNKLLQCRLWGSCPKLIQNFMDDIYNNNILLARRGLPYSLKTNIQVRYCVLSNVGCSGHCQYDLGFQVGTALRCFVVPMFCPRSSGRRSSWLLTCQTCDYRQVSNPEDVPDERGRNVGTVYFVT